MTYIGIDPGKSGALAVINEGVVFVVPFDERAYIDVISACDKENTVACVEQVWGMPNQGITSTFNFGKNYGWTQGVLWDQGITYHLVHPKTWKEAMGVTKDKKTSIALAKKLFPDVNLKPKKRCRVDNDGMAEALLLAEYARRYFGEEKEPCF